MSKPIRVTAEMAAEHLNLPRGIFIFALDRWIRFLGFRVRPFVFWPLPHIFVFNSIYFGTFMSFLFCPPWVNLTPEDFREGLFYSISAGVMFGIVSVVQVARYKKRKKLPRWPTIVKAIREKEQLGEKA